MDRDTGAILKANIASAPEWALNALSRRSVDWYAMSEDLPNPESRVTVDGDRGTLVETVLHNVDRLRDIGTGPDGMIYVLTDGGDLLRMVPAR